MFGGPGADVFKFDNGDGFHTGFPTESFAPGAVFDDAVWDYQDGIDKFDVPDPSEGGGGFVYDITDTYKVGLGHLYGVGHDPYTPTGSFLVIGFSDYPTSDDFI